MSETTVPPLIIVIAICFMSSKGDPSLFAFSSLASIIYQVEIFEVANKASASSYLIRIKSISSFSIPEIRLLSWSRTEMLRSFIYTIVFTMFPSKSCFNLNLYSSFTELSNQISFTLFNTVIGLERGVLVSSHSQNIEILVLWRPLIILKLK